jgi:hypothetical protein
MEKRELDVFSHRSASFTGSFLVHDMLRFATDIEDCRKLQFARWAQSQLG